MLKDQWNKHNFTSQIKFMIHVCIPRQFGPAKAPPHPWILIYAPWEGWRQQSVQCVLTRTLQTLEYPREHLGFNQAQHRLCWTLLVQKILICFNTKMILALMLAFFLHAFGIFSPFLLSIFIFHWEKKFFWCLSVCKV